MTTTKKMYAFSIDGGEFSSVRIEDLVDDAAASKVSLLGFHSLDRIGGADTVIDYRHEITVIIDYPLSKPCNLHISGGGPITAGRFCKAIADMYRMIYKEEARTSSLPERNIRGMLNRASTDGKYGVWGHSIGDLYLEGAVLREDDAWELFMGS